MDSLDAPRHNHFIIIIALSIIIMSTNFALTTEWGLSTLLIRCKKSQNDEKKSSLWKIMVSGCLVCANYANNLVKCNWVGQAKSVWQFLFQFPGHMLQLLQELGLKVVDNVICLPAKVPLAGRELFNSISVNLIVTTCQKESTQHWRKIMMDYESVVKKSVM